MVGLILAQLPVDVVGGEQGIGGGSREGAGDANMMDHMGSKGERVPRQESPVGRLFIGDEDQGEGVGCGVKAGDDIELIGEGAID